MRIGALNTWNTLEAKESIHFPGGPRSITLEVMAIAAEVTISDGLTAWPIGVINGYERLDFRIDEAGVEVIVENGAMSYRCSDLVDIGHFIEHDDPDWQDTSFTSPFTRQDDGIDPAIKMLIARTNERAFAREAFLREQVEGLTREIRSRTNDGAPATEQRAPGADTAGTGKAGAGKPDAKPVAGTEGAPKSEGKPEGDAKPSVGEQPKA